MSEGMSEDGSDDKKLRRQEHETRSSSATPGETAGRLWAVRAGFRPPFIRGGGIHPSHLSQLASLARRRALRHAPLASAAVPCRRAWHGQLDGSRGLAAAEGSRRGRHLARRRAQPGRLGCAAVAFGRAAASRPRLHPQVTVNMTAPETEPALARYPVILILLTSSLGA
jgi:hypothetical protein